MNDQIQKRDAVFYAHVKPINKEYLENLAQDEKMTLSAYFDAFLDQLRLNDASHKKSVSKSSK